MMKKLQSFFWLLMSLFLLTACDPAASTEKPAEAKAPQPVAVSTLNVIAEDIPVHYEYVGQVAGSLEVDIRSRITGIVEQTHYQEGSAVQAGQLLFTLDAAPYRAAFQQAVAAIDSARAQKHSAEAQLKKAQRELKRVTPLASQQMLSQNQQDDAVSAVEIAEAQLDVASAAIKQAEANLLTARINLDYTEIRAPVAGIAGRVLQNRGALVQAGNNSLLTTLVQIDPVNIDFGIPQQDQLRFRREQQQGQLRLPDSGFIVDVLDEEGKPTGRNGVIDFEDIRVDNSTGNFAMRARLANADGSLSPGQFVRVQLQGAVKVASIAVPQRAVLDGPGGKYVYVVAPGANGMTIAAQKHVTLGEWVNVDEQRQNFWIVRSGLEPGDEVIVDGVARIFFPGMPVQATEPKPENPDPTQPEKQG